MIPHIADIFNNHSHKRLKFIVEYEENHCFLDIFVINKDNKIIIVW